MATTEIVTNPQVRAQVIRNLEMLAERYPNLSLALIISNAIDGRDLIRMSDLTLGIALNQLFVSYTQLEAAGLMRRPNEQPS